MQIINSILKFFSFLLDSIRKNPKFFFGFILMLFIALFFKQCQTNRDLENKVNELETKLLNEEQRYVNNIKSLRDSVVYVENEKAYVKNVLRVKEDELFIVNKRLSDAKIQIQKLLIKLGETEGEVKNIYITDITSDIQTNDVMTKVITDSTGAFGLSVQDSNQVYSIKTMTWFNLTPNGNKLKLNLLDRFGNGKSSQLDYNLNFSLLLSQVELDSGSTRVLIQAQDVYGKPIPRELLKLSFVNGVDFVDVKPSVVEPPKENKKRTGWGVMVGPSYGLYSTPTGFLPTWGIGIMAGYKLF